MNLDNLVVDTEDDTKEVVEEVVDDVKKDEVKEGSDVKVEGQVKAPENVNIPENKEEVATEVEEEEGLNVAKEFAKILVDNKVLDNIEGIETFDDITKLYEDGKKSTINDYVDSLPPAVKRMLEASNDGIDINQAKDTIMSLNSISELGDNVSDSKVLTDLLRTSLKMDGYGEEYIDKRVESAVDTATLELEGNVALKRLKSKHQDKLENLKIEAAKQREIQEELYNNWVSDTNTTINGQLKDRYSMSTKVGKEVADRVFNPIKVIKEGGMERPVSFLEDAIQSDPTLTAEIIYLIHTKKIGKNASSNLIKASTSKGISGLEKAIMNSNSKKKKTTKGLGLGSSPNSMFNLKM